MKKSGQPDPVMFSHLKSYLKSQKYQVQDRKRTHPDVLREADSRSLTLNFTLDVLKNSMCCRVFGEFIDKMQPGSSNTLTFWRDVDRLRSLPSPAYMERRLKKIYAKYLGPNAPVRICIPAAVEKTIHHELQHPSSTATAGIYQEAQGICYKDLQSSIYPSFLRSDKYEKLLESSGLSMDTGLPMDAVLQSMTQVAFFKAFCAESHSLETLMFYADVEDCKRLPNDMYTCSQIRKIYDTYLKPHAKRPIIDLPTEILHKIQTHIHDSCLLTASFYDLAQTVVLSYIQDRWWPQFSTSAEFKSFVQRRVRETQVPSNRGTSFVTRFIPSKASDGILDPDSLSTLIDIALSRDLDDDTTTMDCPQLLSKRPSAILLRDTFGRNYLKEFMKKEKLEHYFSFWEDLEEYRVLPGVQFMQHTAKKIYHKYIDLKAKCQVDMSDSLRRQIEAGLERPEIDMFNPIAEHIKTDLLGDAMPRFVKSQVFAAFQKTSEGESFQDINTMNQLDKLLSSSSGKSCLIKFLQSQHSSENILMYEAIESFRRLPSYQLVCRSARKIFDRYLRHKLIPVPAVETQKIEAQLASPTRHLFDYVQHETNTILDTEILPRFLDSTIFLALVGLWETHGRASQLVVDELEVAYLRHRFHQICST